jgi:gluconate kinase
MILVMSGDSTVRHKDVACSLAAELGWRYVDADEFRFLPLQTRPIGAPPHASRPAWLWSLHETMVFALERREPLIVICPPLADAQCEVLRGELRPVRFVALQEHKTTGDRVHGVSGGSQMLIDLVVDVDPHATPERVLGQIRREFGL